MRWLPFWPGAPCWPPAPPEGMYGSYGGSSREDMMGVIRCAKDCWLRATKVGVVEVVGGAGVEGVVVSVGRKWCG